MRVYSGFLFRPHNICLLGVLVSLAAWLVPPLWGIKKGFFISAEWTFFSAVLLFNWYGLIYLSAYIGGVAGKSLYKSRFPRLTVPSLDSNKLLWFFTILSGLGVVATYAKIIGDISLAGAIYFVASGTANELKEALYDDYSVGFVSLRYLILYSASISFYRFYKTRKIRLVYAVNFLLLLMSALLSSRLIFVATILVSLFISVHSKVYVKVNFFKVISGLALLFLSLSTLNYSRNANFYESGGLDFWGGGISSIVTYLGSPFQVAVGGANHVEVLLEGGSESYRRIVDIDETLNTNSAFVHLHEGFGYWSWLYIVSLSFFYGFLFSYFISYENTSLVLPCGAILYAFAEIWRLDLFRQGIFLVWIFFGIVVPLLLGVVFLKKSVRYEEDTI